MVKASFYTSKIWEFPRKMLTIKIKIKRTKAENTSNCDNRRLPYLVHHHLAASGPAISGESLRELL